MSTSGTYSFSVTRNDICRMAMLNLGKLDETEVPTAQEITDLSMLLNMLMKQWVSNQDEGGGIKCWNRRTGYLFLSGIRGGLNPFQIGPSNVGWTNSFVNPTITATASAGATSVTLSSVTGISTSDNIGIMLDAQTIYWTTVSSLSGNIANLAGSLPSQASTGNDVYDYAIAAQLPISLETALLRDSTGADTTLKMMTREEYMIQPSKAQPTYIGDPTAIYWEPQLTYSNIFTDVYGCGDMTKYIVLGYLETAQDITNPLDNPEFPQDWYAPLYMALSKLAAPMFRKVWTPVMESNLQTALKIAHNKDSDEVERRFFQPGED